ncbi:MAG: efflux RND transporter periplasmic adaptor subunit [Usitatibacter sp.]
MNAVPLSGKRRRWPWIAGVVLLVAAIIGWWWIGTSRKQEAKGATRAASTLVVSAKAQSRDVPVLLKANGTVTALQTVDIRAQITSTVREVHIREGQNVAKGDLLFSLDSRMDEANIRKAEAQIEKDKADLATAQRNLERQKDLFNQKFISQAALDTVQNTADTLAAQLAVDTAALESARVSRAYNEIRAPFTGRTGTIGVRAGSLVSPGAATTPGAVLVTITQIDPISVAFTLNEKELPGLQQALRAGAVTVTAQSDGVSQGFQGKVTFVDNAVDTATGTIRVKADFANPEGRLWPGAYVNVTLSPRTLRNATVIPAQAVQTGPDSRFVYVVDADNKVAQRAVTLGYVESGIAVVNGVQAGERVVVEGAQNLRPGSAVVEAQREPAKGAPQGGEPRKGGQAKPA